MSDHDPAPDPMDKAYVQAEAMLDDEAARAARRARVLGAVAREAQAPPPVVASPSRERASWRRGGWMAAASVAGLSALLAVRLYPTNAIREAPPPAAPPAVIAPAAPAPVAPAAPAGIAPPPPAAQARAPAAEPAPAPAAPAAMAEARVSRDAPAAALQLPPPPAAAPPPPPPPAPAAPAAAGDVENVVVTGSRVQAAPPALAARQAPSASAAMELAVPVSPVAMTARLHAAAAAGRMRELTSLLAQGAEVDATDDDGETALMKAVRGNRAAAAALLRRHGADLDLKNAAGESARDMAARAGNRSLDRALGLDR